MRLYSGLFALLAVFQIYPPAHAANTDSVTALSVIGSIAGPDGGWDFASIDANARRLYVAHGDAVMAVDLDSGKVEAKSMEGKGLHAVLPLPNGRILTTNGGNNTATLFDAATGNILAAIPTGQKPDAATFDPSTGLALVMNGKSGDVTVIDPKTGTSPGRIEVGGALEYVVADGHGKAFVNIEDKNEIAVLDIAGRKVLTRYTLPGCDGPTGLAIDPESGLLIAACANGKAIALNAKDGGVAATLPIGLRPDDVIFDPNRKVFFIPCGEGSLAVIAAKDGAAPAIVATIPTQNGARTGALDVKTGRLYLPTADFKDPAPGEKRRTVVPGTFRILVVGSK
jgi:DNA-binding beta-propeller fold protein YncE